ncbi:hypothetical protein [Burkholderia sp. YIM B11467]
MIPAGAKLWRYKYSIAGKENRFAIGGYPHHQPSRRTRGTRRCP